MNSPLSISEPAPAQPEPAPAQPGQQPVHGERVHHPFSPSTLQYREPCPYYDPGEADNDAARAGTMQHEALESEDYARLSDQQAAVVLDCLAYFAELKSKYPGGRVISEEYLPIDNYRGHYRDWKGVEHPHIATTAGYLDRAIISADETQAEICDWKFGAWEVEPAENNVQGFCYLLGLAHALPTLQKITVHFVMPYRDEVSLATFTRRDFVILSLRVRAIVMRAVQAREVRDFSQATPTTACLFCANAGRCDALTKIALRIGHKFSPLQIPEDITPSLMQEPAQAGQGLQIASIVQAWATAYRAQKTAQALEEGGVIPDGYQLVAMSDRRIINAQKLREVCQAFGLTPEEIDSASKFHIKPIDELIRLKTPRGSKEAMADALTAALLAAGAIEKTPEIASLRMKKR